MAILQLCHFRISVVMIVDVKAVLMTIEILSIIELLAGEILVRFQVSDNYVFCSSRVAALLSNRRGPGASPGRRQP